MVPRALLPVAAAAAAAIAWASARTEPRAAPQPEAEALAARLQCLACHAAPRETEQRLQSLGAPALADLGARVSPQWLSFWLEGGHARASGSRMPDLLHGLEPQQRAVAVEDLTHFLAGIGGPFAARSASPDAWRIAEGARLYARLACAACHADGEWEARRLAAKTDLPRLAEFLRDPHATRPEGGMPDFGLSRAEAEALAAHLLRGQHARGPTGESAAPGVRWSYHEYPLEGPLPPSLDAIDFSSPLREGDGESVELPEKRRPERFALRCEGWLILERDETVGFGLESDDGSRLLVDGALVVDNDGHHAPVAEEATLRLAAGRHRVTVEMFEAEGGEALEAWIVRDGRRRDLGAEDLRIVQPIHAPLGDAPFAPDAQRAERGRARFEALGCGSCHGGVAPPPAERAKDWEALDPRRGCLAEEPPPAAPRYAFADGQRELLRALVADAAALRAAAQPAQAVAATFARLRCTECHARGGGGPRAAVLAAFTGEGDLGDEGRVPPPLDGVGAKLRRDAVERVLAGEGAVRPYLHARMPRFAAAQVAGLAAALERCDLRAATGPAPAFDADLVAAGRTLAGTGGLNCVQCHPVAGRGAGALQALDLARMAGRLRPEWFAAWLENPLRIRRNTRMPAFFAGGRSARADVLGGSAERQIAALWSWLSLGDSLPLPDGLTIPPGSYALDPAGRPIYFGAFVAGGSPRVLNVGFPERVHLSFDCENVRLMQVWRGEFMNAEGTWHGRAGALESPRGSAVRALPPGPSFARADAAPWPGAAGEEGGWRMLGHRRDGAGRPTFRYSCGGLAVEETIVPEYAEGGATLSRRFVVAAPAAERWTLRAGPAGAWARGEDGAWTSADGLVLRVAGAEARAGDGRRTELLVDVPAGGGAFEVRMSW